MQESESKQLNPWITIWTRPRETLRSLIQRSPERYILLLSILNGVIASLSSYIFFWITYPQNQGLRSPIVLIFILFFGALFGAFNLYFGAWLYRLTGRWLKGKGSFTEVKCAVGWSSYPFIIVSILSIIRFILLAYPWATLIATSIYLLASLWSFIIFLYLLAEAHQFSGWRALGTLLISFVLVFIFFTILLLIIPLLQPLFN